MARAMKDSGIVWIGSIPSNWKIKPLKYSLQIGSGSTPDSKEPSYWDGEIPWITPADYKTKDVFVSEGHSFITEAGLKSCSTQLVPADSLIFSKRAPIGSVSISANPLTTNQGCLWGIPKQNVDVKYFYYLLSIYPEIFELYGAGTTFKEISATAFGNVKMPVPSFNEQKKIVHFLDIKFSEIISLTSVIQKEIETLEAYKKSLITEAVTKGLDKSVPLKDSGVPWFGNIPSAWKTLRIKSIASTSSGGTPTSSNPDYYDGSINWCCSYDLTGEQVFKSGRKITESGMKSIAGRLQSPGTVMIAMYGGASTIGNTGLLKCYSMTNQAVCNINFDRLIVVPEYAHYQIKMLKYIWLLYAAGTRKDPNISQDIIRNMKLIVPSVSEQLEIANFLDSKCSAIDSNISSKKHQLETLAAYKKSLIYEYVTGKKEVLAV